MNAKVTLVSTVPPGYMRVAAVQIDYVPDVGHGLADPLSEHPDHSSLLPRGGPWPTVVHSRLEALRDRVRRHYLEHFGHRLHSALRACSELGVQAVVLPEYSVPFDLLGPLAQAHPQLVIFAGTHQVNVASISSDIYRALGTAAPPLRTAVCPVLYGGRICALVPKLQPARTEHGIELEVGASWSPITFDTPIGSVGVLICLDFIHTQSDAWANLVVPKLHECDWLAVPSLTPWSSTQQEFAGQGRNQSTRYKRPVVHANRAREGGSGVYCDGEPGDMAPEQLPAEVEGILVVDIDVTNKKPGSHTAYDSKPAVRAVTTPTLIYPLEEPDYASWQMSSRALVAPCPDEARAMQAFSTWLANHPPPLSGTSRFRQKRVGLLLQERGGLKSLDQADRLMREVLVEGATLSPALVKAALAIGAAKQIASWRDILSDSHRTEAIVVADALDERARKLQRALPPHAEEIFQQLISAVSDRPASTNRPLLALMQSVLDSSDREIERSDRAFEAGDYEGVIRVVGDAIQLLEPAQQQDPDDHSVNERITRARLRVAAAAVNVGQDALARDNLSGISKERASVDHRLTMAELYACIGDINEARSLLGGDARDHTERELARRAQVEDSLRIFEGKAPAVIPTGGILGLRWASALFERGDLAGSAAVAARVLEHPEAKLAERYSASELLRCCLLGSVEDTIHHDVVAIPEANRGHIVALLEGAYQSLDNSLLTGSLRRALEQSECSFRVLIWDEDWLRARTPPVCIESEAVAVAIGHAEAGELDTAVSLLPTSDHPWHRELLVAELTAMAGRPADALAQVGALRIKFPRRPLIERLFAELSASQKAHDDSLDASRVALAALPARGPRIALARRLWALGRYEDGAEVLVPLKDDARPSVLLVKARTLEPLGRVREAEEAYREYIKQRGEDTRARVALAELLIKQSRRREAAVEAWAAFITGPDALSVRDLWIVGVAQRSTEQEADLLVRLQAVVKTLERRRDTDPHAEHARLSLLLHSRNAGEHLTDVAPLDMEGLSQSGVVSKHRVEDIVPLLMTHQRTADAVWQQYRTGRLGLVEALAVRNVRFAEFIVRAQQMNRGSICSPISLGHGANLELDGATVVLTAQEFTLIVHVGVVDDLRSKLGSKGHLILPEGERNAIVDDVMQLEGSKKQGMADRVRAAIGGISFSLSKVDGAVLHTESKSHTLDAQAFQRWLQHEGLVERADLPPAPTAHDGEAPDDLPALLSVKSVVLGLEAILDIAADNTIGRVLSCLTNCPAITVALSPDLREWLDRDARDTQLQQDSMRLAKEVHRRLASGLADGWIWLAALPSVDDVPAPKPGVPAAIGQLFGQALARVLALTRLTQKESRRYHLTTEFFGSLVPVPPEAVLGFAWRGIDHYSRLSRELRDGCTRRVHLAVLVRQVVGDASRKVSALEILAELGFPDSFESDDLLDLAERLEGGLEAPRAQQLLGQIECMANEPGHVAAALASLHVAHLYGSTIFAAFCGTDGQNPRPWTDASKHSLACNLLGRLEAIEQKSGFNALQAAFSVLASRVLDLPLASWSSSASSDYVLNPESCGARMWNAVWPWASKSAYRTGSYARALRLALAWVDERSKKPGIVKRNSGTMQHAIAPMAAACSLEAFFDNATMEALAILSGTWAHESSPLSFNGFEISVSSDGSQTKIVEAVSADDLLRRSAQVVGNKADVRGNATELTFDFELTQRRSKIRATVPFEAAILRIESEEIVRSVASQWKQHQGPHDGRAYRLLEKLAASPRSLPRRRAIARHAVRSLWRLIRHDPAYLLRWAEAMDAFGGGGDKLNELCATLSEPVGDLPDGDVWVTILRRCQEGTWKKREDREALMLDATALPGSIPLGAMRSVLTWDDADRRVVEALERLKEHENLPVGRMAADVVLVYLAAARGDTYSWNGRQLVVAHELSELIPGLIDELDGHGSESSANAQAIEEARPDGSGVTLAVAEAALLRICLSAVERVGRKYSARTRLWLGWRFYGWFASQLSSLSGQATRSRASALSYMVRAAPRPRDERVDSLDPFGFAREHYNHRLAAVLHAIAVGSQAEGLSRDRAGDAGPEPASTALENILLRVANRFAPKGPDSDLLGWEGPTNVPDLAVWALLSVNASAFSRLEPETRRRAVSRTAIDPQAPSHHQRTFLAVVMLGCASSVEHLSPIERQEFEEKLRSFPASRLAEMWRTLGFVAMLRAGEDHLRNEVELMVLNNVDSSERSRFPGLLGILLTGCVGDDFVQYVRKLQAVASEHGLSTNALLSGLAEIATGEDPRSGDARAAMAQLFSDQDVIA